MENYIQPATTDRHYPAGNTAAVVTYSATAGFHHVITDILFGYDDNPTGGSLTIAESGVTLLSIPITQGGGGVIEFRRPRRFAVGAAVVVTLAAGGGTVAGKLTVGHRLES